MEFRGESHATLSLSAAALAIGVNGWWPSKIAFESRRLCFWPMEGKHDFSYCNISIRVFIIFFLDAISYRATFEREAR